MARLESIAVGGYFKTPTHLLPSIAALVQTNGDNPNISVMDPCAGEGEAIISLLSAWSGPNKSRLYACEMEKSRFAKLSAACSEVSYHWSKDLLHCDAFCSTFTRSDRAEGVSVLFLNPPYHNGKLEFRFLQRFTPALTDSGVLIYIVPFYALALSAELLASEYEKISLFRFPKKDYEVFKQVVLFAVKKEDPRLVDQDLLTKLKNASHEANNIPILPESSKALYEIPSSDSYYSHLSEWVARPVDVLALMKKARPWEQSARPGIYMPIRGILPDTPIKDLLLRKYPVATPPRPAHIASGIAAGIFNGSRMEPDDPSLGLPPLLVKGVFRQEYRTVEEKVSKDHSSVSYVQVQQPKLITTVLDLRSHKFYTLGTEGPCVPSVEQLTIQGLLSYYGLNLMQVMLKQCPVSYDPRKDGASISLADTARKPFDAQAHAVKALIKLLGGTGISLKQRRGKAALLLGEIGSGKSTVSLIAANTIGSLRPLIVCPPHLLTSWQNEISAILPDATVQVLDSVTALETVANSTDKRMIVSLLSRETAKLSHGWVGVSGSCPKCGSRVPKVDLVKKRSRCDHQELIPCDNTAKFALKLANFLVPFAPDDNAVQALLYRHCDRKRIAVYGGKERKPFPGFPKGYFNSVLEELLPNFRNDGVSKAIIRILACISDEDTIVRVASYYLDQDQYQYYEQNFGRDLLLLLPPRSETQTKMIEKHRDKKTSWGDPWGSLTFKIENLSKGEGHNRIGGTGVSCADGELKIGRDLIQAKSLKSARSVLSSVARIATFNRGERCGEFLYQAVPEPRRVALARHIIRYYPDTFDFLIVDEAHEYASDGSAQEHAAHRLVGLGIPTIEMTGSIMNGYAESLFTNMWSVSPEFRDEFKRSDKQRFIDRYGYRKRVVTDSLTPSDSSFGSRSDRVLSKSRIVGTAPGVLPLFVLKHLLPLSVTLHKEDLALGLPPCTQSKHLIDPNPEQKARYNRLKDILVKRIREDQRDEDRVGKLFGQLAELPSYLDRCTSDTGNFDGGYYDIRYPESLNRELVVSQPPFNADILLPKESWMLGEIRRELEEGRNVMVFSWHVSVLPRLAKLISDEIGEKVPILYANKVATAKRQDWITKQVVNKRARVMVTNPVAIQTGLNNLIHFSTEIWMENPACNPIVFRQAGGRIDRIGQHVETRIKFPVYSNTLQEQLYELLLQKVAVSISTDGLDPESALLAAGVGSDDYLMGLSIGKQLWAMLSEDGN